MALSPNRTHDRKSFFKYMPAATAGIVLTTQRLRWSSPQLFNDPFDVPREMSFGITPEEIVEASTRRIAALVESPPEDTSNLDTKLRLIVETVKKGISSEDKDEILAGLKNVAKAHNPTEESMRAFRELWRNMLPTFRILCLTESPAHTAMWFHYAEQYKGAVLEFRCDDELDSAWLRAQPVTYPDTKPEVYTAEGWAELLTKKNELAVKQIFDTSTLTKTPDWSYENEWRVVSSMRPADSGLFSDYKFHPQELMSVYLGPLVSSPDKDSLLLQAAQYPNTKVFDVSLGMSREMSFHEIRI